MVTTTPRPGLMKGQRAPTAIGRVEIATPHLPVCGHRAEMAKVENASPNRPSIAWLPAAQSQNDNHACGMSQRWQARPLAQDAQISNPGASWAATRHELLIAAAGSGN